MPTVTHPTTDDQSNDDALRLDHDPARALAAVRVTIARGGRWPAVGIAAGRLGWTPVVVPPAPLTWLL